MAEVANSANCEAPPDMDELLLRLEAANQQLTSDKKFIAPPSTLPITSSHEMVTSSKSFDSCDSGSLNSSSLSATLTQKDLHNNNNNGKDSNLTGGEKAQEINGKLTRSSSSTNGSICSNSNESSFQQNGSLSGIKVEELWRTWSDIITGWDQYSKKMNNIHDLIVQYCGIPEQFRPLAWQLLAFSSNPEPHAALITLRDSYAQLSRLTSSHEKAIRRDVQRTYPELPFFQSEDNQQSLFNIIKAYSLYDKEVGYCQGSAFLAGLLLMQNLPEEDAFCVLVQLMQRQQLRLRDLYKPTMSELSLRIFLLERCLCEHLPRLYEHLMAQGVHLTTFATQWFLTLFAAVLPLSLSAVVMDLFLVNGLDFLLRFAIALLQQLEAELLRHDMEGVIKVLQRDSLSAMYSQAGATPERYQTLVKAASDLRLSKKNLSKWEKDFVQAKSKEQEDQVELRRLRTENRLLRQRIENLEKETGELADRLIKGQVCRAEEADIAESLRAELSRLKRLHATTVAELDAALLGSAALQGTLRALKEVICFGDGEGLSPSTESTNGGELNYGIPEHLVCILDNPDIRLIYDEFARLKVALADLRRESADLRAHCEQFAIAQQMQTDHRSGCGVDGDENSGYENSGGGRGDSVSADGISTSESASLQIRQDVEALRNHLKDIEAEWQSYRTQQPNGGNIVRDLQDQLMALRLKEADTCAQLIHARHAVIDIEAQHQSDRRTLSRLQERVDTAESDLDSSRSKERTLQAKIADLERQVADLKAHNSEAALRNRILAAEHSQGMAEMRQRTAQLELEKEELQMARKLLRRLDDDITTGDSMATSVFNGSTSSSNGTTTKTPSTSNGGENGSGKLMMTDSVVLKDEDDEDEDEDEEGVDEGHRGNGFEDLSVNVLGGSQEISPLDNDVWAVEVPLSDSQQ